MKTMKEVFDSLDLRTQLTDDLKSKWYYTNIVHSLIVNEKSVIFSEDFSWRCRYCEMDYGDGDIDCVIIVEYFIDGTRASTSYFSDFDRYLDPSSEILERICVYIANYI